MAKRALRIVPNPWLDWNTVWDATPGAVVFYAPNEKEAVLARVRHNRLIDLFAGMRCYSIQSHLRTTLSRIGEVEVDELYVGMNVRGIRYVFPLQARGPKGRISVPQVEQGMEFCRRKYPQLICRPIAAQTLDDGTIALLELCVAGEGIRVRLEGHYRLVPPSDLTAADIEEYRKAAEA